MVNVALLGCGRWGSNHLRTLARLRDSGIVGKISVVDISETVRNQAELADFTAINIDDVDADLVIIATPSNLHSKQAIEMIRKGKLVLVEKPLVKSEYEAA